MGADNVRFQIADREKFSRIVQGDFRMGKAVKPRVGVGLVPVIEKQVVEQAAPGSGHVIQGPAPGHAEGHIGHKHRVLIAAGPILKMPIKELVEKYGGNLDLALSSSQKSASLTCISKRIDDYNKGNKTGSLDNIVTSKSRSCQSPKSNARSQEMFWPKNVKATSYDSPKNTTPKKAKAESPGKAYVIKAPKDGEMPNYSRQRVNSNNSRAYLRKCMLSQKNI